jgi:hypothetical protein
VKPILTIHGIDGYSSEYFSNGDQIRRLEAMTEAKVEPKVAHVTCVVERSFPSRDESP